MQLVGNSQDYYLGLHIEGFCHVVGCVVKEFAYFCDWLVFGGVYDILVCYLDVLVQI